MRTRFYSILLMIALLSPWTAKPVHAQTQSEPDYLDAGELAAIGAGSVALWLVGTGVNDYDPTRRSLWNDPLPGEAWLQRKLGGDYYPGKTNFLDNNFGSGLTAGIGTLVIGVGDLSWPRGERSRDLGQDMYLYTAGLLATKGITTTSKGVVRRPRPMVALEPELAAQRQEVDSAYDRHSFFSGHSSSAFFSMTYTNKRVRSIMRQEMSSDE